MTKYRTMTITYNFIGVGFNIHGFHHVIHPIHTKKNAISVLVNRLTKLVHFLPINKTWNIKQLAQLQVTVSYTHLTLPTNREV